MTDFLITTPESPQDADALDELLWRVLWEPTGLPRDIRTQFKLEGEALDLVAKEGERVIGGAVAVWTGDTEVELRHLAIDPDAHGQGVGRALVEEVITRVRERGCTRLHTIARNTSADFFRKMGFTTAPGTPPEHPDFLRHGISFELMERRLG